MAGRATRLAHPESPILEPVETDFVPLGEQRLQRILDAVIAEGGTAETHYLEVKSDIDLRSPAGITKVAKFILGAANRLPAQAAPHLRGHAVMVLGAARGTAPGLPAGTESHDLNARLRPYLGPEGPQFDLGRLPVAADREVLFVVVAPPEAGQPPYPCHKDYQPEGRENAKHALQNGALYVRVDSATRLAKAAEVLALVRRGAAAPDPVDLDVTVAGRAARLVGVDPFLDAVRAAREAEYRANIEKVRAQVGERGTDMLRALSAVYSGRNLTVPSPKEVEQQILAYHKRLEEQRVGISDYYVGVVARGVTFTVTNSAASYLREPHIDVLVHGCRGVNWQDIESADLDRVAPPVASKASQNLYGVTSALLRAPVLPNG